MGLLSKKDILDSNDCETKTIEVPEWGGDVNIATMTGFARDRFEASILGKSGGMNTQNIRAKLVAACLVDDSGELVFNETDIAKLGKKSCSALDRIFTEAQKLNGFSNDDVEELAKN